MLAILAIVGTGGAHAALEDEVREYEARDAAQPPPAGAILFVGSSSIGGWTNLSASFPGRSVLNRGFGGSQMSDLLDYFDRLVVPYNPSLMVVYEGDNDLAGSKTVARVFNDYLAFANRVEQRLPATEVIFLAVKPSPSRASVLPRMAEFNALLEAFCADKPHFRFVDIFTPMLDDLGQPRPELFRSDMLHMVTAGYTLWASVLEPVLADAPFLASRHVLVDFGVAATPTTPGPWPNDPVNAWNNVSAELGTSSTGLMSNLIATDGVPTPFDLVMVSPFAGASEAGATTSVLYPPAAAKDSLFGHAGQFQGQSDVFPGFKLTGLDPGASYRFTFFASIGGAADPRETVYTVTGDRTRIATLDASNNTERLATVPDMVPDATGAIAISLSPGPANDSPPRFAYLGVLKIEERPPLVPVEFVQEPADRTVEVHQSASFGVVVTGSPPIAFEWFLDGEAIPDATGPTYIVPEVTPAMNGSRFSVKASNARSEATSRQAVLEVVPDATPPVPLSARSADGVIVEIVFSESLDPAGAAVPDNYSVYGGLVPVLSAGLRPDGRTVELTLAHRVAGEVSVGMDRIRDVAGNPVVAATAVVFQAPVRQSRMFLIDFGAAGSPTAQGDAPAQDPLYRWNNVAGVGLSDSGKLDALVTAEGETTAAALVMLARFNGANENGTTSATPFPVNATRDSLFGNTENFSGMANVFPGFKLTGLAPDQHYNLTFYASRTGVSDNRETGYTVAGATTGFAALNVANNLAATADVNGIVPTAEGDIVVSLAPTPANTNSNHFTYLGVLRVRSAERLELNTPRLLPNSTLVLDWTGHGLLEWSADLTESSWSPVIPAPVSPWFESTANAAQRFYRVRPVP